MYFPYFITYMIVGFCAAMALFFWALKNGQFRDQQRARYLPLEEEANARPVPVSAAGRLEVYGLFILAAAGLGATAALLAFSLFVWNRP